MTHPRLHAAKNPDKAAIVMAETGATLSYRELSDQAERCSHWLRSCGLTPGDHVAILMENRPEYLEIAWAAINSGFWFTPISTHLGYEEVAYIINDCDAQVLFAGTDLRVDAQDLTSACPRLNHIATADNYPILLKNQPNTAEDADIRGGPMLYSSGTTGRPKGIAPATETAGPLEPTPMTQLLSPLYGLDAETIYLSTAPLYHTAPLKFNLAIHSTGGTSVICSRFDAAQSLAHIEKYAVTHSQWVPTMLIRLLKLPDRVRSAHDLSSHRVAIHAAAPCPGSVKQAIIDWWGPILYEYYGGTESVGFCAISPEEFAERPGSVGKTLKGTIRILDDDENELPTGAVGNIYFEDGSDFEYHNDPEKTARAYSKQGWNTMGDVGYVDGDGYLYLTDRKHDTIISGGVNIYPQETENLLVTHPHVADAAVFGVPNDEFGEEVKACVQLVDQNKANPAMEDELIAFCRERLSKLKCPRSIDFLENLPRQPNGKLHKRELKARYKVQARSNR